MSEYMDIVNEADEVIGRDTRENVHANHAIHRGVHVFVVSGAGLLLVQQRSPDRPYYPGYWDASAGGQVMSGESYEKAASRELLEELGCHGGPLELVGNYNSYSHRQREKRALFVHTCEGPFEFDTGEIDSIEFASAELINERLTAGLFTEGFVRSFELWSSWKRD